MGARGPKPKPPEEHKQRRNVSVDADVQEMLSGLAAELEPIFGFRPTLSQTIRFVVLKARPNMKIY
jgi:hypothetical protein